MESEIWHDDLYATRTRPIKKRQCKRKPCVTFSSENGLQPDEIVIYESVVDVDELTKKYKKAIAKATYLEAHIRKDSVAFTGELRETLSAYDAAKKLTLTDKQKLFCEQRIHLLSNMKSIWR